MTGFVERGCTAFFAFASVATGSAGIRQLATDECAINMQTVSAFSPDTEPRQVKRSVKHGGMGDKRISMGDKAIAMGVKHIFFRKSVFLRTEKKIRSAGRYLMR
jgi:hypothetical protein